MAVFAALMGVLMVSENCSTSTSSSNGSPKDSSAISSDFTPEGLAKECCDCYKEMKSYQNDTKRANKLDECMRLTQINLSKLNQLGIDNDWNNEKVKDAQERFDAIYDNCEY